MVTRNTGGSGISFGHSSPLYSANTWTSDQTFTDDTKVTLGTGGDVDFFFDGSDTYLENVGHTGGVMIGLSASPPAPDNDGVHIWKATAGSVDAHAASVLTVEGSDSSNVVLQLLGPNSSQKAIFFGEPASNVQGIFGFYGSGDSPANTFRWQIDGDQRLLYSAGAFAFQEATTISTSSGNLTISSVAGSNVLIGDGTDLIRLNGNDTIDMLPGGGTIGMRTGASNNYGVIVGGSMTAGTTDSLSAAFAIGTALTGASGDISWLTLCQVDGNIVTQEATESIGHISSLMVDEPLINDDDLTGDITVAATIYIRGAPDEGLTNAAIAIAAGDIKFLDSLDSASVADQVAIGAYEVSPGDRVLALSSEADVAGETDETKFSHKLKVRINGATYYMMLTAT